MNTRINFIDLLRWQFKMTIDDQSNFKNCRNKNTLIEFIFQSTNLKYYWIWMQEIIFIDRDDVAEESKF